MHKLSRLHAQSVEHTTKHCLYQSVQNVNMWCQHVWDSMCGIPCVGFHVWDPMWKYGCLEVPGSKYLFLRSSVGLVRGQA